MVVVWLRVYYEIGLLITPFPAELVAAHLDCYSFSFLQAQAFPVDESIELRPVLVIVVAYLPGSVPFGYLIVRAKEGGDIRQTGSGGTGATNVSRRAGKLAGVFTLVLDALKGAAAVAVARLILGLPGLPEGMDKGALVQDAHWWVAAAAVMVIVGHIFPIWLRFRGGKGVATGVGVFVVLAPVTVALAGGIFFAVVVLTRYVSLGSIVAAAAIPLLVLLQNAFIARVPHLAPLMTAAVGSVLLIMFAHRGNIGRLIRGAEHKFK